MPAELHGKAPEFHNDSILIKVQGDYTDYTHTRLVSVRIRMCPSSTNPVDASSTLKESGLWLSGSVCMRLNEF